MTERPFVGGQAVIGGVMMRTRDAWAIAVRAPTGTIDTTKGPTARWPRVFEHVLLVRGAVALVETMSLGLRALSWSAARDRDADEAPPSRAKIAATTVLALGLFTVVFAVLPALAARAAGPLVGDGFGRTAAEGALRLALFVGYVAAIGRSPAIATTFAYHGAEHKVVAAFEAGDGVDAVAARAHSRRHARCGTDFLLLVVVVAIVVFSLVPAESLAAVAASRVVLLPLVAGIAYEVLRLSRRFPNSAVVHAIVAPGLALQALTTREPDDAQLEVAAVALREALGAVSDTQPASA